MSDGQQLLLTFEAKFERYMRNFERAQQQTDRRFKAMEKRTQQAGKRMEDAMQKSSSRVAAIMKNFGAGVAGGILGGLTVAGINRLVADIGRVAEGVANIGSAAKRAGIDVKAFQELSHVADQNRISVDALTDGMKELQLRADEFIFTGKGPAAEAFARLGFSASNLKRQLEDPSALLVEIIGRLEHLDRAAQIRIADELFGGTAGERFVELLDRGAAGIRQQIEEANRLGLVLDEGVIQRADEIDRKYKLIARTIETEVKGAVVELAGAMLDWWDSLNTIEEQQSRTIQLGLQDIYERLDAERRKLADLQLDKQAFPGDAAIDLNIDRQQQLIEELTQEAMRLRDVLDRRNGYDENFIYKTGEDAKATTPPVNDLNNALANTGMAGSGAVSGINSYADAIRALKDEIPELADQLATLDARTRIDAVYRQALQKARTMGEIMQAGKLRDTALGALASKDASEAASRGMLHLIGHAEGTDKGRGYNETLGYGAYTGGPRNLVMMTLDQIDAMQTDMLRHPDNPFNSSAAGRYQIVQKTLRGLRDQLGLSGDEFFDANMQDRLAQELLRQRGNDPAGLRNEWEGLRRIDDATIRHAYDGETLSMPAIDPGRAANIEQARQQADAYAEIVMNAKQYTAQMGLEQSALSMTAVQASALRYEQQMLNEAQRAGIELTPQQRQEIQQLSQGMASAEQAVTNYAATQEQAAEASRFFGSQAVDALTGILTGTMTAEEALQNLLKTLVRAALQAAILGEGPLAGLLGGGGAGGSKGAVGGGGGKAKAGGGILGALLGFSEGGFTGHGPKHQPAGVVHKGEVVWSQSDVRRAGGVHVVEAMRVGARGYADGGVVARPPAIPRMQAPANQNVAQPITINNNVTVEGGGGTPEANADLAKRVSREMEVTMRSVVADEVRRQARPGNFLNSRGRY